MKIQLFFLFIREVNRANLASYKELTTETRVVQRS